LLPNGNYDSSFIGPIGGVRDRFLINVGNIINEGYALAIQSDGKIVLAGYCWNSIKADFCVARLNPDGTRDAAFDGPSGSGNDRLVLPIGTGVDLAIEKATFSGTTF
jgi:hypothetical protein